MPTIWRDTFEDPTLANWDASRGWTGCDDVEPWDPAHFKPFYVQDGALVIQTDPATLPVADDAWCYRGLPSQERFLSGDFDLGLTFDQLSVSAARVRRCPSRARSLASAKDLVLC